MKLISLHKRANANEILYNLLKERTAEMSISHKGMPTWEQHCAFIGSKPYLAWHLIEVEEDIVGSIYLTKHREIGIFIGEGHKGKGYGRQAVELLMSKYPGRFLANIAPMNAASFKFFEKLGFVTIQHTLEKK